MELKIIETKKQYEACMLWLDGKFEKGLKPNTDEGEEIKKVLLLVKEYEDKHFDISGLRSLK